MISPNAEKKVLEAIQSISVSIAVLDERLKNHIQLSYSITEELHIQNKKIEETKETVTRHQFLFRIAAWIFSLAASGLGVKSYFQL